MKKIIMMFALVMGFAVSANAQTALVDNGTAKDNWYFGVGVGTNVWNDVNSWTLFNTKSSNGNNSWWRTQPVHANVTVGKMITPYVGAEVDYSGVFNLENSKTFLDAHNLTGNVVFNVTNLLAGYQGHRRCFELELIGGAGWVHEFDSEFAKGGTGGNALSVRGALRGNVNVSKNVAITVTPEYLWLPKQFTMRGEFQCVNLSVGLKYRIPTTRGNFQLKQLRNQAEVDALNATIASLQNANAELTRVNANLEETIRQLLAEGNKVTVNTQSIGSYYFDKGKYNVDVNKMAGLVKALKDTNGSIVLTGTTSPEGSESFNKTLAEKRANAIKDALVANGVDASRIKVKNGYDAQRSVVILVE